MPSLTKPNGGVAQSRQGINGLPDRMFLRELASFTSLMQPKYFTRVQGMNEPPQVVPAAQTDTGPSPGLPLLVLFLTSKSTLAADGN